MIKLLLTSDKAVTETWSHTNVTKRLVASVRQKPVHVQHVYAFSDKRQRCDRDLVAYTVSILLETCSHTNVTKRLVTTV